jgi:ORF11
MAVTAMLSQLEGYHWGHIAADFEDKSIENEFCRIKLAGLSVEHDDKKKQKTHLPALLVFTVNYTTVDLYRCKTVFTEICKLIDVMTYPPRRSHDYYCH